MLHTTRHSDLPETANAQLEAVVKLFQTAFGNSLLGLILHGSAASSGFDPECSDLDLLAIVDTELTPVQLQAVGQGILSISNEPHPIEISVVAQADLDQWSHPCTHLFHYGEDQREAFASGELKSEVLADADLAAHVTLARARGIDLLGTYPIERLPVVPRHHYLDAVLRDFEWAECQTDGLTQYTVANACRTLAYLHSGVLLSKSEGVKWCRDKSIDLSNVVADVTAKLRHELGR